MSKFKCAVVFATLITVSGIFPEMAKAQTTRPNFLPSPLRVYGETSILNPYNYRRIKPDGSNVSEESTLMSKAWNEQFVKENYQAAADIYVRVIQKYPQSAQAYFNLGVLLKERSNKREMSTKLLRTAYKLFQQEGDSYMVETTERHLRNQ
jgi:tetratricopeptide (TPR) repeat protein